MSSFPKGLQHPKAPNYDSLRQDMLSCSAILWILRNLADPSCDMLRGCTVFHALRFLQMNHLLSLLLVLLVLSVLIRFAPMEHPKLEKIDFGATIHASFNEFEPIHIPL